MPEGYQPGEKNIGNREKKKRYAIGFGGLGAAFLIIAFKILLRMPDTTTLILFLPLVLAFEGFYQGYFSFCAAFARQGIYDISETGGKRKEVSDSTDRKQDLEMSRKIHLYSVFSAIFVTFIVYLIFSIL